MCGIAGYATLDPRDTADPAAAPRMLRCIAHRGPDDEGVFTAPGIALGHRRLSVIDVAGGHQPLFGARPTTVVVVNGEIYNYRELAQQLHRDGHRFATASDSEVAAHAYDRWGLDFLQRLDGMYALALWDGERRRLVLARDRMGEKPLFYTVTGGLLIFASELSAILAHPAVDASIDPGALSAYLTLEYVPAPASMIRGVYKLEPGHVLVLENGRWQTQAYWTLSPRVAQPVPTYADAVAELRRLLEAAVRSRLVSDVPLGVFLSGGIDSSTIAALAARAGALETFSIGFQERSFDESQYARRVAAHIGSHHHERIVTASEMPELVPRLGALLDEPVGDASILPTAVLSRFARERVTVALGGDGGDELFAGYPMHQAHRVAAIARAVPGFMRTGIALAARSLQASHRNFDFRFKVLTFLRGAGELAPANHLLWMSSFSAAEKQDLLEPDVLESAGCDSALAAYHRAWSGSEGAPLLGRATHLDAMTYLPNDILTKVDRASMAVALEVRAPFLAKDVVEFAFSLPDAYRMRGLQGKRLLRDALRSVLPSETLDRPKKGFGMPVAAWLAGPLRPLAREVLSPDALREGGLFRPDAVMRLLDEHDRGDADHRKPLWTLLVFELWRRQRLSVHAASATLSHTP
jgi:asparagine synthase (glutamine-hydrolysing)